MSKYYKAEDVINAIEYKIAEYIPTLYGRYEEIPLELRMAIESLPTIEVNEDCISREMVAKRLAELWETEHPEKSYDEWLEIANKWCDYFPPSATTEHSSMVGEWLHKRMPHDSYHITGQCSICKERSRINNYCPWCGAKMKGEDE